MKPETAFRDVIIIGSSPISLLEALYQNKMDKKVLILEQRECIGGAWSTVDFQNFTGMDIGCHILERDKDVYAFLKNYLDIDLQPLMPQPKIVYGNMVVPYIWKNICIYMLKQFGHLYRTVTRRNDLQETMHAFRHRGPISTMPYLYPKLGSYDITRKLLDKIDSTDIEILVSTQVNAISLEDHRTIKVETNRMPFASKELIFTRGSEIKMVYASDDQPPIQLPKGRKKLYYHAHIVFEGSLPNDFSYWRFAQNPVIHRLSNLTNPLSLRGQIDARHPHTVLLAGVYDEAYHTMGEAQLRQYLVNLLTQHKLIDSKMKLVGCRWNVYQSTLLDQTHDEQASPNHDVFRMISSDDLVRGIQDNLARWQTVLTPSTTPITVQEPYDFVTTSMGNQK